MMTMQRLKEHRYLRAGNTRQEPVRGLDHMHLLAHFAQTCRRLKPDIATANNDGASGTAHGLAQEAGVIRAAQNMHAGQPCRGRQLARDGPGCQHQRVIA